MLTTSADRSAAFAFDHEAVFFEDVDDFLRDSAAFIAESAADDEPVLVAVASSRLAALRAELGRLDADVEFVAMELAGRNPGRMVSLWMDFLDRHPGRAVRGIGEPIFPGRSEAELQECQHHEHLLNHAFGASGSFRLRCPYHLAELPGAVVDEALRSHPIVRQGDVSSPSPAFDLLPSSQLLAAPLARTPSGSAEIAVDHHDLRALRAEVAWRAASWGLDAQRGADVAIVVCELLTNSIEHGVGPTEVTTWTDDGYLVFQVVNGGYLANPLAGRARPKPAQIRGRGLWIAHELTDLLQLRSNGSATIARASFRLPVG